MKEINEEIIKAEVSLFEEKFPEKDSSLVKSIHDMLDFVDVEHFKFKNRHESLSKAKITSQPVAKLKKQKNNAFDKLTADLLSTKKDLLDPKQLNQTPEASKSNIMTSLDTFYQKTKKYIPENTLMRIVNFFRRLLGNNAASAKNTQEAAQKHGFFDKSQKLNDSNEMNPEHGIALHS